MLTSRQMGKSSMMDYTDRRLEAEGVRTARISLERIGTQDVTPEHWYLGLAVEIQEQLGLATDALDYWEEHEHLSLTQCLSSYDEKRTPFNIGQWVKLGDFDRQEAEALEAGLGADAGCLLDRILYWTDGHPFLTLRLCDSLADHRADDTADLDPVKRVDKAVHVLFFDQQAGQDLNLDFVNDMLTRRLPRGIPPEEVLLTYQRILRDSEPDEVRSPIKNHLKLSGVVKRDGPN